MFICCEDFISAGLTRHEECCTQCHADSFQYDEPRKFRPLTPERYRGIKYYCCCSFSGREFTAEQMELVCQLAEGRSHG